MSNLHDDEFASVFFQLFFIFNKLKRLLHELTVSSDLKHFDDNEVEKSTFFDALATCASFDPLLAPVRQFR